jgi:hypothetical protein
MARTPGLDPEHQLHGRATGPALRERPVPRGDGRGAKALTEYALWAIKHNVRLVSVQDPEMLPEGRWRC